MESNFEGEQASAAEGFDIEGVEEGEGSIAGEDGVETAGAIGKRIRLSLAENEEAEFEAEELAAIVKYARQANERLSQVNTRFRGVKENPDVLLELGEELGIDLEEWAEKRAYARMKSQIEEQEFKSLSPEEQQARLEKKELEEHRAADARRKEEAKRADQKRLEEQRAQLDQETAEEINTEVSEIIQELLGKGKEPTRATIRGIAKYMLASIDQRQERMDARTAFRLLTRDLPKELELLDDLPADVAIKYLPKRVVEAIRSGNMERKQDKLPRMGRTTDLGMQTQSAARSSSPSNGKLGFEEKWKRLLG